MPLLAASAILVEVRNAPSSSAAAEATLDNMRVRVKAKIVRFMDFPFHVMLSPRLILSEES
jgi:hypothetical protein